MSRYIKLASNGVIFNATRIVAIVQQELNNYAIVLENSPVTLKADGNDVDMLMTILDVTVLEKPVELPKVAIA